MSELSVIAIIATTGIDSTMVIITTVGDDEKKRKAQYDRPAYSSTFLR